MRKSPFVLVCNIRDIAITKFFFSNDDPKIDTDIVKPYIKFIYIIVNQCQVSASGPNIIWFRNKIRHDMSYNSS